MTPRMLEKYKTEVASALQKEFGYGNVMQLPRIKKIVVNIGVGDAKLDIKFTTQIGRASCRERV